MNYLVVAVLAIIAWQLVVTIACFITNEKENIVIPLSVGVWFLLINIVGITIVKIKLIISKRRYNIYQVFGDVKRTTNYMEGCITSYYMTPKLANKFARVYAKDEEVHESYSIRLSKEGKDFKAVPWKSDILKEKDLITGTKGLSADFLKKFLKRG